MQTSFSKPSSKEKLQLGYYRIEEAEIP